MFPVDNDHHLAVTQWFQRAAEGGSVQSQLQACERVFAALWQRSHLVLGEVTLIAIVERVLHTARERYPFLSIEVDSSGLHCPGLQSRDGLSQDQVSSAIRFVLEEFLTVLGNLTAQILTPALHAELSKDHNAGEGVTRVGAPS